MSVDHTLDTAVDATARDDDDDGGVVGCCAPGNTIYQRGVDMSGHVRNVTVTQGGCSSSGTAVFVCRGWVQSSGGVGGYNVACALTVLGGALRSIKPLEGSKTTCTCPAAEEMVVCKHCVAVLLAVVNMTEVDRRVDRRQVRCCPNRPRRFVRLCQASSVDVPLQKIGPDWRPAMRSTPAKSAHSTGCREFAGCRR